MADSSLCDFAWLPAAAALRHAVVPENVSAILLMVNVIAVTVGAAACAAEKSPSAS